MEPTTHETAAAKPSHTGRPRKNDDFTLYDSALYQLLLKKLPPAYIKAGRLDTDAIREGTGNARFTVYRWLNEQRLSKNAIKSLLKIGNGKLKQKDLIPFFDLGDDL
ncbi:hypothetical protein EN759_04190 [Mesorhizobium sp. M00.F.Ca.ET.038.03.1.1]|nr:hypothetical protein EN759_04190 [Mesorhizobium sp. M00.F.Ca.ET.038.03.1.1]TIW04544.1 MAG: hypothetical protein E5V77_00230 [Mesorhizobium sp.]